MVTDDFFTNFMIWQKRKKIQKITDYGKGKRKYVK